MPLWGITDTLISRPSWINLSTYPSGTQLVFVDENEASNPANKEKGITGPGWWLYYEYMDSDGNIRYKTENVVALSKPVSIAGDAADDSVVPNVPVFITITTQPSDQTTVSGEATFSVVASISPFGTLEYQWQKKAFGTMRWVLVPGATSDTLTLTSQTAANNGDRYRVVIKGSGAKAVISKSAKLIFGT